MKIDDPCSAFPVHGAAGLWGVISVGLFAQPEPCMLSALRMGEGVSATGLFRGGGWGLLGVQVRFDFSFFFENLLFPRLDHN